MSGHRSEFLRGSRLEPEETAAVMAIEASNVTEFAIAIERIVNTREAALRQLFPALEGKGRGCEERLGLPWTISSVHS